MPHVNTDITVYLNAKNDSLYGGQFEITKVSIDSMGDSITLYLRRNSAVGDTEFSEGTVNIRADVISKINNEIINSLFEVSAKLRNLKRDNEKILPSFTEFRSKNEPT